jgi:hypothetical protein
MLSQFMISVGKKALVTLLARPLGLEVTAHLGLVLGGVELGRSLVIVLVTTTVAALIVVLVMALRVGPSVAALVPTLIPAGVSLLAKASIWLRLLLEHHGHPTIHGWTRVLLRIACILLIYTFIPP